MSRYPEAARRGRARVADAGLRLAVAGSRLAWRPVDALVRRSRARDDRGDVPGWVLVTLMTAGLVTALWVVARDRLTEVFNRAITSVTGQ
jgi:hypothetical protein